MIIKVTDENKDEFLSRIKDKTFYEVYIGGEFLVYGTNSDVVKFYLLENNGVMQVKGSTLTFFGKIEDNDEFDTFINFSGVNEIISDEKLLFKNNSEVCYMQFLGEEINTDSNNITQSENLFNVVGLICEDFDNIDFDNIYADICKRKNMGIANVYTLIHDNEIVCTASAYSVYENKVYLSLVATKKEYRNRKFATNLVNFISKEYDSKGFEVLLNCEENLEEFYKKIGFKTIKILTSSKKEEV